MVFFIVGLPTFLMGCNQSLSTSCVNYNPVAGIAYEYLLAQRRCKSCKRCPYHDCYNSYAKFHFGKMTTTTDVHGNTTVTYSSSCTLEVAYGVRDRDDAMNTAYRYQLGKEYKILHSISDRSMCKTDGELVDIWIAGLTFLLLSGLVLLCCLGFAGNIGLEKYHQNRQVRAEQATHQDHERIKREADELVQRAQALLRDYHKTHPVAAPVVLSPTEQPDEAGEKNDEKVAATSFAIVDCEEEDEENGRSQQFL